MSFENFSGIKILAWFLGNPTRKIHFKDLCRELRLAPSTIKSYCEEFLGQDWIREERTGNMRFFYLNNDSYVIKSFKRAYFLESLKRNQIETFVDETAVSFALYGSHASGEYDEKSDIDLFLIGNRDQVHYSMKEKLEKKLGKSIQVTILSLGKWEKNKNSDPFLRSVLKNNVLLRGAPL